jgi:hypothetical protein
MATKGIAKFAKNIGIESLIIFLIEDLEGIINI